MTGGSAQFDVHCHDSDTRGHPLLIYFSIDPDDLHPPSRKIQLPVFMQVEFVGLESLRGTYGRALQGKPQRVWESLAIHEHLVKVLSQFHR